MFGNLTRLQCCPPTCGAAAAVVVSEAFAARHGLAANVAIVVAFFALCLLFVRACAAIAGPEPADVTEGGEAIVAPEHDAALQHVEVTG